MHVLRGVIRLITVAIAMVIVIGIVLVVADANEDNGVVAAVLDVARFFVKPFRSMFDLERGKEELQIAINWGIGALVYLLIGSLLLMLLRRVGRGPRARGPRRGGLLSRLRRRRRPA